MFVDSHCHLDYFENEELEKIIKESSAAEVKIFHSICTKIEEFDRIKRFNKYKNIFISIGQHPCNVDKKSDYRSVIINLSKTNNLISIGETGLDYYRSNELKDIQRKSFLDHIYASIETNLPLVIHNRSSDEDMVEILKSEQKNLNGRIRGVIHCFQGDKNLARKFLDLGMYISFSGIITFKKSDILRDVVKFLPEDKILIETDSPYLSPEPVRGKKNYPQNVKYIAKCLGSILNKSDEYIGTITTNNFFCLFNKAYIC